MELKIGSRYLLFDAGHEDPLQEIEVWEFSPSKRHVKLTLPNIWKNGVPIAIWRKSEEVLERVIEELEGEIPLNLKKEENKYFGVDIENLICPECSGVKKNYDSKQKEYILVKCDKCNYLMGLVLTICPEITAINTQSFH